MSDIDSKISLESLAQQWAKKYLQNLQIDTSTQESTGPQNLSEILSPAGRQKTVKKINDSLRSVSAQAWNKTEALLSTRVQKHHINAKIINPWEIAADSFKIYQKVLDVYIQQATIQPLSFRGTSQDEQALGIYTEQLAPSQLATVIGGEVGALRRKYTSIDPKLIGYVSMQFHYTSQMLIESLTPVEQVILSAYFKVVDDYLYMPLERAYRAAAAHDYNSPVMSGVQHLLPRSTQIARNICQGIIVLFPNYNSISGTLTDSVVKISSVRDVEMFQVYLWVCALEGSLVSVQEELFPLCVMLYPVLKVHWDLVRQMLHLLRHEIQDSLTQKQANTLMPYFQALSQMFCSEELDYL